MKAFRIFILVLGLFLVCLSLSLVQDGTLLALESQTGVMSLPAADHIAKRGAVVADKGVTTRASVDSTGVEGNGYSSGSAISGDGLFVAFESEASNLVANDSNFVSDVFVHDLQTGQTTRVSVDSAGVQGYGWSGSPAISSDGRFVSFRSRASNLVPGDSNFESDIFVHDRKTGQTSRVSVDSNGTQGNLSSYGPAISDDGRFVAFDSRASNLVPDDSNERSDIFVHDMKNGETTRVSVESGGVQSYNRETEELDISGDGRFVAFEWWPSDVPGETNGPSNIYVHDRQKVQTSLVSANPAGLPGKGGSRRPALSADGRFVVFSSLASDLVANDSNDQGDVFIRDQQSGQTSLVSVDSAGVQANESSGYPDLSGDGRLVAFRSVASNLVPDDSNDQTDIFVHDRKSGETSLVSVDSAGVQSNEWSGQPAIAADGQFVVFQSGASNLVPGDSNGEFDIFVHDRGEEVVMELELLINKNSGAPGSFFTAAGAYFPRGEEATVTVNGQDLGTVGVDGEGAFTFILSTTGADEGSYSVMVSVNPSATVAFTLDAGEPIWPQEGDGTVIDVPAGLIYTEQLHVPVILK